MKLPTTPQWWAIHLSKLVKIFHEAHGLDRFPIKIASIATEYSRNVFPDAPITKVEGLDLSAKFEGMLLPHPNRNGEWGIIYNSFSGTLCIRDLYTLDTYDQFQRHA